MDGRRILRNDLASSILLILCIAFIFRTIRCFLACPFLPCTRSNRERKKSECRILRSSNWEKPGIGPEQSSTCGCTSRITIVWQAYRLINHSKMVTRNCHVTLRSASVRKKSILFIVWQIEVNELLQTKSDKRKRACYCCSWCSYGIYDEACTQLLLFSLKS